MAAVDDSSQKATLLLNRGESNGDCFNIERGSNVLSSLLFRIVASLLGLPFGDWVVIDA